MVVIPQRLSLISAGFLIFSSCILEEPERIDRFSLVNRHNVIIKNADTLDVLTVGNGNFAFSVDITGLQTFPEYYLSGIPLGTLSNWGWHSYANRESFRYDQVVKFYPVGNRMVGYYHDFRIEQDTERAKASLWLRENPHRMNLGFIGLEILKKDSTEFKPGDIRNAHQILNLWKGEITSDFEIDDVPVNVKTVCHPDSDMIAVRIASELITNGRLNINIRFPEADPSWRTGRLWGNDMHHLSTIINNGTNGILIRREQDTSIYFVNLIAHNGKLSRPEPHFFRLHPDLADSVFTLICHFTSVEPDRNTGSSYMDIAGRSAEHFKDFWETGGAIDFSRCIDKRARELERRVILSRYLTKVNCSGTLPPQETGLTYNSWHGKFHLEMHWWHGVHFLLWQQPGILEKQMTYYFSIREKAKELAEFQGYSGIRWPKMTGPDGFTSPSTVGNYLIWQQPHFIFFAEMLYRSLENNNHILSKYSDLVFETAEFMADFALFDTLNNRYILAPPLIPAQETFPAETTINPSFELTYWAWGLQTAIEWKKRSGMMVPVKWQQVLDQLSEIAISDSFYLFTEDGTDSYSNERYLSDHPMILGCYGMLPPTGRIDENFMENSFNRVMALWHWDSTWGWDYPMAALTAAMLGKYDSAVNILLMDVQKNRYLPNGHNYQDQRLTIYLPGNGALLTAVALMCTRDQFPKDGNWQVKWEDLFGY